MNNRGEVDLLTKLVAGGALRLPVEFRNRFSTGNGETERVEGPGDGGKN